MSKFQKDKVLQRYLAIAVLLTLVCIAVIIKAGHTMTIDRDYWMAVSEGQRPHFDTIPPTRGNILSCDGQLLATSIPEYEIFIDFNPGDPNDTAWARKRDSLWYDKFDSICDGLHAIFPQTSTEEFRAKLKKGHDQKKRYCRLHNRLVDYNTYCEVKKLPFLNMPPNRGGFNATEHPARRHPCGSLADRTIGSRGDTARYGIELSCDSILRGEVGVVHMEKTLNQFVNRVITPPVPGADIVTTLDVSMQDMAEKALRDELILRDALMGVALLMEVQTGDVKAIVNLTKVAEGDYRERYNDAISYRCEPGSVFKTASMLVAFDAGVDSSEIAHVGGGVASVHGHRLADASRRCRGDLRASQCLEYSSNIGVSQIIERHFGTEEGHWKFAEGLHRVGIAEDLKLDIAGYKAPYVRWPDQKGHPWYATTLAWMSIGYETQIAPINTLAFYNAIANDGRLMRPRFIKGVEKDGQMIQEYPPVVLREQIAKPAAVKMMQTVLHHVVTQGLGKRADPMTFPVAGKTGTAQVSGKGVSYHGSTRQHWLSFAGFFPADKPRYSCIVCVKTQGGIGSGGTVSASVFRKIAEGVIAKDLRRGIALAHDDETPMEPQVKRGDNRATAIVLHRLGLSEDNVWTLTAIGDTMPDLTGMGARDATYLLEKRGLKVMLHGRGSISSQSIAPGTPIGAHRVCSLQLN